MREEIVKKLKQRFADNQNRHSNIKWQEIENALLEDKRLFEAVLKMEETGGEPDVVVIAGKRCFVDCSEESPKGRRSLCYDKDSRISRKEYAPKNSALEMADEMGVEILTEVDYSVLQTLGEFDLKTSSWVETPSEVRDLGGAVFADRRYDRVFFYHNGAESYYASRGFRGKVFIGVE